MAVVTLARRPVERGESWNQFNLAFSVTAAQDVVAAVAGRYGVISRGVIIPSAAMSLTIAYGGTTIAGPFEIATGIPFYLPCSVMCPVANTTITIATDTASAVTFYGMFHYDSYTA